MGTVLLPSWPGAQELQVHPETISAAQRPSPEVMTLSARLLTGSQAEKLE